MLFPRSGTLKTLAGSGLALTLLAPALVGAAGKTRSLSFYNLHTKETVSFPYKRDGKYIRSGLKKANWILRDWRRNEPTKMDPKLLDILWEIHRELGSRKPIHIISGYRSLKTNNMLRRTKGGQAKKSQHILGKAADVYFPDVPLKKLRYSGLVREQGGVGYYPTSGTPFVHIDTGRVRHWPRLPRYELALLFPKGSSKHRPSGNRPLSRKDVRVARAKYKRLAVRIARFHDNRKAGGRRVLLASAAPGKVQPPVLKQPRRPVRRQLAALSPSLLALPKLVRRPRVAPQPPRGTEPTSSERDALAQLSWTASLAPQLTEPQLTEPQPTRPPRPALRPIPAPAQRPTLQLAALPNTDSLPVIGGSDRRFNAGPELPRDDQGAANTWVIAPAYDEEHPEELSYRPFAIAPLLTASASSDDPALIQLTHPDVARTLELLDGIDAVHAMQFRPGLTVARLLWSRRFTGTAVNLDSLNSRLVEQTGDSGLSRRQVVTTRGG